MVCVVKHYSSVNCFPFQIYIQPYTLLCIVLAYFNFFLYLKVVLLLPEKAHFAKTH